MTLSAPDDLSRVLFMDKLILYFFAERTEFFFFHVFYMKCYRIGRRQNNCLRL